MTTTSTPPRAGSRLRLYQDAKRIVEARIVFWLHLVAYLAVNSLLVLINQFTMERTGYWSVWPALFWGAGLLVHGCFVLLYSPANLRRLQDAVHGRKALELMMGLLVHLSMFVVFNILFLTVNLVTLKTAPERAGLWSLWVVMGWGIAVAFHSIWVYLNKDHKLKRWKRRKALAILERWGGLS